MNNDVCGPTCVDLGCHEQAFVQQSRELPKRTVRFKQLNRDGVVSDQADLIRMALVSRARVTKITDLLILAPDIREILLFLPLVHKGRDPITEREMRRIMVEVNFAIHRARWNPLSRKHHEVYTLN